MRTLLVAACSAALVVSGSVLAPPVAAAPDVAVVASKTPLSKLEVRFAELADGFAQPTSVADARDGTSRLFVAERTGRIRVYRSGKVQPRAYLDIRSRVQSGGGEQGLLGLAFPKNFSKSKRFFVAYVARNGSLQVSRFSARSAKAARAKASSERKVLNVPHPGATNHNGGALAFGPDGRLYISTGDGGGSGDPGNNAQDRRSLLGKILRIDVRRSCGPRAYCVPRSNPYAGSTPGRAAIWAVGLRNPWRISFDTKDGSLWVADVGQSSYEEVNRIPAGAGGRNYGWPCKEARSTYDPRRCVSGARYRPPVESYGRALGQSITGGAVYRGRAYRKHLAGRYVFADFVSGRVWARTPGGTKRVVGSLRGISSFGTTTKGEIRAVTLDGGLYALRASRRR